MTFPAHPTNLSHVRHILRQNRVTVLTHVMCYQGADLIALGVVWGVASCGGPILPYRGGRVDATAAGRLGVPQPQEALAVQTERFRLQGFNATEMISLVACGHTLGGVRNTDFPSIVPGAATELVLKKFDGTNAYDSSMYVALLLVFAGWQDV